MKALIDKGEPHIPGALVTYLRERYPVSMALNARSYDELQYVKGAQDLITFLERIHMSQTETTDVLRRPEV